MEIKKGKLLIEGGTKKIYTTTEPDVLIMHFKDDVISSTGKILGKIKKKGITSARLNELIYQYLESYHVPTHWVEPSKPGEFVVKSCQILPLIVTMHNEVTSNLSKRYGLDADMTLQYPILELNLKNAKLKNPLLNSDHACAFGFTSTEHIQSIENLARKINAVLKSFFKRRNLILVQVCLEFGLLDDQIVLTDEISLDTCRFWGESEDGIDKKLFDQDLEKNFEEAYSQFEARLA